MFLSFLFSKRDLRAPSADRRETLPRDQKVLPFYNLVPTFWEVLSSELGLSCTAMNYTGETKTEILILVLCKLYGLHVSVISIDKVPGILSPVLAIHGTEDEVIGFTHGLAIYERCPRPLEPPPAAPNYLTRN